MSKFEPRAFCSEICLVPNWPSKSLITFLYTRGTHMRTPVILISVFLLELGLLTRCALVTDPAYNTLINSAAKTDLITNVKVLSDGTGSYSVYWYNYTTSSIYKGGPGYISSFLNMGRCTRFNMVPHPTKPNSVVIAGVIQPPNVSSYSIYWAVVDAGTVTFNLNIPGVPTITEPGLAFTTKDTVVLTYDSNNQVKRRSTTQLLATKGAATLNTTDNTWGDTQLYASQVAYQIGGSVSAVNGTGDWLAVWDDTGSHSVLAKFGNGLALGQYTLYVSQPDDTMLHTPVVAYPFIAYVGNSGNLYLASVRNIEAISTTDLSTGSEPHLYTATGKIKFYVLSYVRASNEVCIRIQSVQYSSFSEAVCWTENFSTVTRPSSTVLPNGSIVVSYLAYDTNTMSIKTQTFVPKCGDGIISMNEECDGERNCNTNCTCKPMDQRIPSGATYGCPVTAVQPAIINTPIADVISIPVVATPVAPPKSVPLQLSPDVVPLLDCYVLVNSTHVRGYFSYENLRDVTAQLPITLGSPANAFSAQKNRGQPTTFTPGRSPYFPASVFATTWTKDTITWYLTNYQLPVDPTNTLYLCPQNVSVDIDVSVSKVPNATELAGISAQIANELGVDPSLIVVTIDTTTNGSATITVTIIGSDSLTSAIVAEKLVEVIKTTPSELEDKVKSVMPIEINQGSVRGKPDSVAGQRGESSMTPTPNQLNSNSPMSITCSFVLAVALLVLVN